MWQKSRPTETLRWNSSVLAAYCRVSTKEEEQASSYEAQCEYYTDKIMSNKEWTMAGIFADAAVIIGLKTLRLKKSQKHAAF